MRTSPLRPGFTLMEILLVLGILGILATIVLVAINPNKQLQDARTANRYVSMREIESAIAQYIIDGNTLANVPSQKSAAVDICQGTLTGEACTGSPVNGFDLSVLVPEYLVGIPVDPSQTGSTITGYRIYRSGSFTKICAKAVDAECGP